MKKPLLILLAFIYMVTTSGIVISTHYCMGEVAGYALGHSEKELCDTCGMDNDGCCHDELSVHQLKSDHQSGNFSYSFSLPALPVPIWEQPKADYTLQRQHSVSFYNSPPPVLNNLQARLCVFRI
jgi:hypothetical protein